ncbi:hypothetical protein GGF38_000876, partial [Coemansia sp. RSA 25]
MVDAAHSATQTLQAHQRPAELKQSPRPRTSTAASAAGTPQQPWRGRDVVFVDPLDASIVPTDEVDATMGCTCLGPEEYLVKYFEDFKYSTVNGSELRIFDTSQPPFTDFAKKSASFLRDKAIKGALSYLKTGHVHTRFQWRLWMTGSETLRLPFVLSPPVAAAAAAAEPTAASPHTPTAMLPGPLGSSKAGMRRSDHLSNSPSSSPPPLPAHVLTSAAESDVSTLVSAAVAIATDDDDANNTGARSLPASPGGLAHRLASESDHHHEPLHRSASPARAVAANSTRRQRGNKRQQQHTSRSATAYRSRRHNPTPPPDGPSESPNSSGVAEGNDDDGGDGDVDGDDDGDDEPEDAQGDDEEDVAEDDNNAQPQQMLQPPHIISKKPSKLT